jgi:predicted HicB family RNase H-like nuclease
VSISRRTIDSYAYRVLWSEEDGQFIGLVAEFPSLSWIERSDVAALGGIKKLVREVVVEMKSSGEPIPAPLGGHDYSGQFKVRIPPSLHRRLALEAAEARVSLNRLVSMKLASM